MIEIGQRQAEQLIRRFTVQFKGHNGLAALGIPEDTHGGDVQMSL